MTKKPSKDNIPPYPTEISKWQRASVELVQLKFKVHNILNQFSQEEKQSDQYKELTDILRGIIVHVIDDNSTGYQTGSHKYLVLQTIDENKPIEINTTEPEKSAGETSRVRKTINRLNNTQTLIIGGIIGIITAFAPYIADIIRAIVSSKGAP